MTAVTARQALEGLYEAWNRDDLDAMLALFTPGVEVRTSGAFLGTSPVYRGREGLLAFWEDFNQTWESLRVETEGYEEHGERTLALFRFVGHGRGGVPVEREGAHVVRVEDGLIADLEAYESWDGARRALVLRDLYDAWNRRDVEAGVALTHPDVEFYPSGDFPGMADVYRGRGRMRAAFDDLAGFFERLDMRVHSIRDLSDGRLLAIYTFVGRGRDGVTVERDAAQLVEVEDGLVRSMRTFGSWAAARAAAGLEE